MTFSYDPNLSTDKDWVRFLVQDAVSPGELQDEEIIAVIAEETATGTALKFYSAARCLEVLSVKWSSEGDGVMMKKVEELNLKYGLEDSAADAIEQRIKDLRTRGSRLLITNSPVVIDSFECW